MNPRNWRVSRRMVLGVALAAVVVIAGTLGVPRQPETPAPPIVPFSEFLVAADRAQLKSVAIDGSMLELTRTTGETVRVRGRLWFEDRP